MATDNKLLPPTGTGTADIKVATRTVTYSGEAADAQAVGIVAFAGSDDAKTVADIPGDATNGLYVNATLVTPGTGATALGKAEDAAHSSADVGVMALAVRQDTLASLSGTTGDYTPPSLDSLGALYTVGEERLVSIVQTPTVSNAAVYASGDAMGGLLTFANAARFSGGPIVVESVIVTCKTPALAWVGLELRLFDVTFTAAADNAVNSLSDADSLNSIGVIRLSLFDDYANNTIFTRTGIGLAAVLQGTSLFGDLITRSAVTLTSTSDIQVKIVVRQG